MLTHPDQSAGCQIPIKNSKSVFLNRKRILMKLILSYSAAWKSVAVMLSAALLSACEPPTRVDFIKYPSLRQKWSMICDARSNAAELNAKGCDNLRQWQSANQQPGLMNQNLGK